MTIPPITFTKPAPDEQWELRIVKTPGAPLGLPATSAHIIAALRQSPKLREEVLGSVVPSNPDQATKENVNLRPAVARSEPAEPEPATPPEVGDRDALGREVRRVWIAWAHEQPAPKPSWLVPWEELSEPDREVDRRIGEALYRAGAGAPASTPAPAPPALAPCTECSRLRALIDRDRTGLGKGLSEILDAVSEWWWVCEGRGPYEWDDDRYRAEMANMLTEVKQIATDALGESGKRADAAFHPERAPTPAPSVLVEAARCVCGTCSTVDSCLLEQHGLEVRKVAKKHLDALWAALSAEPASTPEPPSGPAPSVLVAWAEQYMNEHQLLTTSGPWHMSDSEGCRLLAALSAEPGSVPEPANPGALDLRPEVRRFAQCMETQLRANDHKGGWHDDGWEALLRRLREETKELARELRRNRLRIEDVVNEAADVANFAMMIADNSNSPRMRGLDSVPALVETDENCLAKPK